ncbi:PAS domain S-box protein [Heliorestis acidaminivorans]|uniref:PAS domain S-box protein n=1 Tax=Heliorestis acidaminivorans TaxID=553427 RepID=A0A6I0ES95_9FIRM|nr:PAS domain S-box protein [Heliorestis acidaminivorans]KAB2953370.1 PAS domain S-box protein [Heliorestis acidaminivorans]
MNEDKSLIYMEARLRKLESIIDNSKDAIIIVNKESIITSWNKGAEKIYGYQAEEICGQNYCVLKEPSKRKSCLGYFQKLIDLEKKQNIKTLHMRKDGKV